MEQMLRLGATAGVIGFVAVGVFTLCCVAAMGLVAGIIKAIGDKDDEADTTHTH